MALRRSFDTVVLAELRQIPASKALGRLAIVAKADPSYTPLKNTGSRRWHVRTTRGEFEIITTGVQWYDTRARTGGGGAIDLAMHILGLSFVGAVRRLRDEVPPDGTDYP
ncbi:hypothetical protein [Paraburkholderia domus]|uniref:Uncharacterized protein n=1 Tax=Paraburkholderia domus TaxID=2793075 RepID=A0A9N8N777_9BURK|nr:hypothetical protein [Paraburkholderia domus]MBK5169418.1 hypothetical protein [Burkholderia sp. R-70211]CAE6960042.1 hypothetical protein R70211_06881 [Paraburkholderia domus]